MHSKDIGAILSKRLNKKDAQLHAARTTKGELVNSLLLTNEMGASVPKNYFLRNRFWYVLH